MNRAAATFAACALLAAAGGCAAQALVDPTRPMAPAVDAALLRAADVPLARPAAAPASAPVLQAVQLPLQGRASALVDGQVLRIGDRLGALAVVAIDDQGITLRQPRGSEQRLTLVSGIRKTPSLPAPDTEARTLAAGSRKDLR